MKDVRCGYCDGSGHVHNMVGEWLGQCSCGAWEANNIDSTSQVKCGGDGIANTRCNNPEHVTTKWGATYSDWTCHMCGGSGRNTWD